MNSARYGLEPSIEPDNSRKTCFFSLYSRIVDYSELVAGWLVQVALRDIRILGDSTCTVSALIKHGYYFRCAIRAPAGSLPHVFV